MAVDGFFLGGAAEGISDANKQALARDTLTADIDIRNRSLSIQDRAQTLNEKNASRAANQEVLARIDKQVSDTMGLVSDAVKAAQAVNADPLATRRLITPLVDSAKSLYAKGGGDPASLDARVDTYFAMPTGTQAAAATVDSAAAQAQGKIEGETRGKINAARMRGETNLGPEFEKDKVSAENALRDDYMKSAGPFVTIRDARNRINSLDKNPAGDIALVYSFMKILDPGSTVREGEFATAANAGGINESVRAMLNKALGEGNLSAEQRRAIVAQSEKIYQAQAAQHDKTTTQFANTAKRQGLNVDNVIMDLTPGKAPASGKTPSGLSWRAVGDVPPPPAGFKIVP